MTATARVLAAAVAVTALSLPARALAHTLDLNPVLQGQGAAAAVDPIRPAGCPSSVDPKTFASADELYGLDKVMADFGARTTGSPQQTRFVNWLERYMSALPAMRVGSITYGLQRWTERSAGLRVVDGSRGGRAVPSSSAVPYSRATGRTPVTAPLVYVPPGTNVSAADVRGKIVVRDFLPASIPNAVFTALQWWDWDPDLTLTKSIADNYVRDWLSGERQVDMAAAEKAGAAGLVFVHQLPAEQVKGLYAPYDGTYWSIPALYVGVDQGEVLKHAAASGQRASLRLVAPVVPAKTRMLIATLPGASDERLVVASHTDGMNAVWDNGPISMLAMASHFAALPAECRPRTLQFVFTTGHLFQALGGPGTHDGSARLEAQQLDADYDKGTVAAVMTVEHMGARSYAAVPRGDGLPGSKLVPTGGHEANAFFFGESPAISQAVHTTVVRDDLPQTLALRGADLPGAHVPMHHSFGGEGGPYHQRLIPTIGFVTGPWTLFGTGFSIDQMLDKDLMRQQTVVFTDILHSIETLPREALAGGYLAERDVRTVLCTSAFASLGLADCPPDGGGGAAAQGDAQWLATVGRLLTMH